MCDQTSERRGPDLKVGDWIRVKGPRAWTGYEGEIVGIRADGWAISPPMNGIDLFMKGSIVHHNTEVIGTARAFAAGIVTEDEVIPEQRKLRSVTLRGSSAHVSVCRTRHYRQPDLLTLHYFGGSFDTDVVNLREFALKLLELCDVADEAASQAQPALNEDDDIPF